MKNKKVIRGSGGGGKGGGDKQESHVPVEADDSLSSAARIRIIDLLCEGEIVGLVDGAKSIFLNETALVSDAGIPNFTGVSVDTRTGTQSQSYMPGFPSVQNEVTVGVEMICPNGTPSPIIRQITNPNINKLRVRVSVPSLTTTDNTTGDVNGGTVSVSIYLQPNAGSYTKVAERTVSGKSSSKYEFTLSFDLTGDGPWNVKVQRDTPDSGSQYTQNKTVFETYTEIVDAKLKYPNSAYIGVVCDAKQFSSVPTRYYDVKLLKVKVPTNYDPETREYAGEWDGDFKIAWTDNPAWCFYDLLTESRYGLGNFLDEDQVDKWSLYTIGQYCDEFVSDGFGGTEPRFTCNLFLPGKQEAYTVLQNMSSIFRGMLYWASGSVTAVQDSPQESSMLYTPSNVGEGKFTYQGASAKARHSVALVSWNDPEDFYKTKVEYVEDQDAIVKYGVQQTDIVALGCTSRGQAHRLGKWLLYTEQYESEICVFKTGTDGTASRPGQIISVADPVKAGVRLGGRISSATLSSITVDDDILGSPAGTISAMLPDGSTETRTISGYAGRTISVTSDFSIAPNSQSIWIISTDDVAPQTFRVIGTKEEEDGSYIITALRHEPQKFDFVENDLILEPRSYSILNETPSAPANLSAIESLYQTASEVKTKIIFSWDKVDRAVGYLVRYRRDNENAITYPEQPTSSIEILDVAPGVYTFEVIAVNAIGKQSPKAILMKEIFGKTAPPGDVQNFSMIPNAGLAQLTWDRAIDLDVLIGGFVRIRHSPRTVGQEWKHGVDIIPAISGSSNSIVCPLVTGTYMAKFVDSSGNFSDNETIIVTTVPDGIALNFVATQTESPGFAGVKDGMFVDDLNGALVLSSSTLIDDIPDIDGLGSIDFPGPIIANGTYDFENPIDLGGVWPTRIRREIDLEAFDVGNLIDERLDLIDDWIDIDGDVVNDVNAELYVQTTEDDPSDMGAVWTVWKLITSGEYTARGFKFQLRCSTGSPTHNLYIKSLGVTLDVEDRTFESGLLTSGTALYSVAYDFGFFASPSISVTATNMGTGDYWQISSQTEDGFDIVFKNSSGTIVDRNFYVLAKGYGRKVG